MAQLIVRNIEEDVAQKLKERAAKNGVSAEEEHRNILREAVNGKDEAIENEYSGMDFKQFLMAMPNVGTDEDFSGIEGAFREVDLSD